MRMKDRLHVPPKGDMRGSSCSVILMGLALAMPLNFSTLSAFYGPSALLIFGVARWTDHGGAGFWGKSNFGRGMMASFDERAAWSTLVSKTASTNFTPEAAGPAATQQLSGDKCAIKKDTDYHGDDIKHWDGVPSAEACCALCYSFAECHYFTWKPSVNKCWAKPEEAGRHKHASPGHDSGHVIRIKANWPAERKPACPAACIWEMKAWALLTAVLGILLSVVQCCACCNGRQTISEQLPALLHPSASADGEDEAGKIVPDMDEDDNHQRPWWILVPFLGCFRCQIEAIPQKMRVSQLETFFNTFGCAVLLIWFVGASVHFWANCWPLCTRVPAFSLINVFLIILWALSLIFFLIMMYRYLTYREPSPHTAARSCKHRRALIGRYRHPSNGTAPGYLRSCSISS